MQLPKPMPCRASLRWSLTAVALLFAMLLAAPLSLAQSGQGILLGTVKDATGAIIPQVRMTLTNMDEGIVRDTVSNSSGNFQFLEAKAAHYTITATADGFEKWSQTNTALAARQQLHFDIVLRAGNVKQEVVVNGDSASAIETQSGSISAVYTHEDVENLPVNNRAGSGGTSGLSIIATLPGVQSEGGQYSLQGGLPFQSEVVVDGITIRSAGGGNNPIGDALPSTEAISEVRSDGVGNSAEFGQPGEISIVTKGGSNKLHGSAFWYHQNAAFDSIPFGAAVKPHKVGNTFGGRVSGAVVIPHFYDGHNRTFFFGDYEGYRFPQTTPSQQVVPTAAMKRGDFSGYSAPGFAGLKNPFQGGAYGGALPSNAISPIATKLLAFFPDPNHGDVNTYTDGQNPNYYVNQSANKQSNQFDLRGDQYLGANQKFLIWGRFTWKDYPSASPQKLLVPSSVSANQSRVLSTNVTWSMSHSLINETHFGYTFFTSGTTNSLDGKAFTDGLGLQGLQNLFFNGLPYIGFQRIQGLTVGRLSSLSKSRIFVYTDALSWTKGNHTFKFGGDIRTIQSVSPLGFTGADNYGTFSYTTSGSAVGNYTGVDFADFLTGIPNGTAYDTVSQDNDGSTIHYHFFAQDQWKILNRLTLSYGLRYELHPGYTDAGGDIGNFDPSVPLSGRVIYPDGKNSLLAQNYLASANACNPDGLGNTNAATVNGAPCMPVQTATQAGFPSGLKHYPHLRFMPRFGFAYRPFNNDKTAIRGSYGIYNITLLGSNFYSLTGTLQAATTSYVNTYNATTHAIGYQWPSIFAGSGSGASAKNYGKNGFGTANSTDWKDPYTQQWSLSVDHDFGQGYGARASYIGSVTRQLVWAPDLNTLPYSSTVAAYNQPFSARLFPNWGVINTRATGANSSYNALQGEISHRFQRGLTFNSSYTFAKAMADNQGPNNTGFASESGGGRSTSILSRHADFGNVVGNRRQRWSNTAVYDLPLGRGKKFGSSMPRLVDVIAGGWRVSSIFVVQSGAFLTPYFPGGQGDPSGTGSGISATAAGWNAPGRTQHADDVAGVSWKPSTQNRTKWVEAGAFTCPGYPGWKLGTKCTTGSGSGAVPLPIGRFGNSQVGSIVGPGLVNLSSGLSKTFSLVEGVRLRAEGTFTNVLNHTNLANPNLDLSNASAFGTITAATTNENGGNRSGQISLRLEF
jgi:hypothetical protein